MESATSAFGKYESEIIDGKHMDLISLCDPEIRTYVSEAKRLAEDTIFNHRRKVELELGAYNCISTLLDSLCGLDQGVRDLAFLNEDSRLQ